MHEIVLPAPPPCPCAPVVLIHLSPPSNSKPDIVDTSPFILFSAKSISHEPSILFFQLSTASSHLSASIYIICSSFKSAIFIFRCRHGHSFFIYTSALNVIIPAKPENLFPFLICCNLKLSMILFILNQSRHTVPVITNIILPKEHILAYIKDMLYFPGLHKLQQRFSRNNAVTIAFTKPGASSFPTAVHSISTSFSASSTVSERITHSVSLGFPIIS